MVVYKSPRRARYPSIISTDAGDLLLLFTRQTEQQEEEGIGDLVLSRSSDGGKTWSVPQVAYPEQRRRAESHRHDDQAQVWEDHRSF